jgi:hypothetical protein
MNRSIILSVLLALSANSLSAQEFSPPYEYSTSSAPTTVTYFNFDITNSLYFDSTAVHELIYRVQPETVWNSAVIDQLYQACSTFTFSGSIDYQPPSHILEWYFRSEIDTAVVSQSPKNNEDLFPVSGYLMADLGADAVGDVEYGGSNNVDITHCYASYSDSKLYFRLDNNGGGFPTGGGLFTYYIYSVGLINPNSTDSTAYVLLYADNPLYQPGWPEWPPEAGFIGVQPVTTTAVIANLSTNDVGKTALFIPSSHLLDFAGSNTAPALTDQNVSHDAESVTAAINFTDAENNLPIIRSLHFEDTQYDLQACEKDYGNGATFSIDLTITESNWYHYYFEFSDGVETVSTPFDSIYIEFFPTCCIDLTGNVDYDPADIVDLGDLTALIDYLFISFTPPACMEEANVDGDPEGLVDLGDLTALIDYLFISFTTPAACS